MAKQQILLVDADSSSARVLEVSLRSAGFTVTSADSAENALIKLEHGPPDLILTDTRLPGADGFGLVREIRSRADFRDVPIVFLTEQGALEDKLRGLELGVDDYLAKPIFVREVVTRVHMLLARRNQQRIAAESLARTRFSGSLEDVAVVDLLQTITISGKSGVAVVSRGDRQAQLYFRNGQLIDAEVGDLRGEEAVYRTISWTKGTFDLEFRAVDRQPVIDANINALLMEGLRRVDELGRLAEQLPPETTVVDIDHDALLARLNEIPDELNGVLRLIDGRRTLLDLIDGSPFDDLSTLTVLSKFYFEGLLIAVTPDPADEWVYDAAAAEVQNGLGDSLIGAGVVGDPVFGEAVLGESTAGAAVIGDAVIGQPSSAPAQFAPSALELSDSSPPSNPRPLPEVKAAPAVGPKPIAAVAVAVAIPPASQTRIGGLTATHLPASMSQPGTSRGGPAKPGAAHASALAATPKAAPEAAVRAPESQRPTPLPSTARIASPDAVPESVKVTPKIIVEIGDASRSAAPPRQLPRSPFRTTGDSDIRALAPVAHTNGASQREKAQALPEVFVARLSKSESVRPAAPRAPVPASVAVPPPLPEEAADETDVRENSSSSPSFVDYVEPPVPSEREFFDAGDEGTYQGGPRSSMPAPLLVDAIIEEPLPVRRSTPAQIERYRKSTKLVAVVLVLALGPVLVAVWRSWPSNPEAQLELGPEAAEAPVLAVAAPREDGPRLASEQSFEPTSLGTEHAPTPGLDPAPTEAAPELTAPVIPAPTTPPAGVAVEAAPIAPPVVAPVKASPPPVVAPTRATPVSERLAASKPRAASAPRSPKTSAGTAKSVPEKPIALEPESSPRPVPPPRKPTAPAVAPRRPGEKPPTASFPVN